MDIGSGKTYPSNALSNFAPHPFEIDEVACNSMEGFLQSLKFKSVDMQREVCTLVGYAAKKKGFGKNWQGKQTLHWNGVDYNRGRQEYQDLLNEAYEQLNKNTKFRKALEATKGMVLTHNIGKTNSKDTILTRSEFCRRLTKLRDDGTLKDIKNKNLF